MPKKNEARHILPHEEWPYEVPKNWIWGYIEAVCSFIGGGTPAKANPEYWNGNIPWASIKDIKGDYLFETIDHITQKGYDNSATNLCEEGDLLLATRIEPGKTIVAKAKVAINQDLKIVKSKLAPIFLHYCFKTFRHQLERKSSGSTVKGITIPNVQNTPIPLPPLPEQQRIVTRIESLFAKLDAAEGRIKDAVEKSERLRASVLHLAFTGELTKKWREDHGVGMESWRNRRVDSFCKSLQYGTSQKSQKTGTVIVLRMGNLRDGEIDWSNLVYTDNADDIKKYKLDCGDVLFNRTNSAEHVGKTSIYRGEYPAIYAGYLIKLDYNRNEVIGDYLNFALNSSQARAYCKKVKSDGVNQSNINAKKIGAYEMPIPTLQEQQEIVRILNTIFDSQKRVKEIAEQNLVRIARMKKSLLALAFRGQLGTNNPAEESMECVLLASS